MGRADRSDPESTRRGGETGRIEAELVGTDASALVSRCGAVEAELEKQGCPVIRVAAGEPSRGYRLSGQALRVFGKSMFSKIESRVSLEARLEHEGRMLLDKDYASESTVPMGWGPRPVHERVVELLNEHLRSAASDLAREVRAAALQPPAAEAP